MVPIYDVVHWQGISFLTHVDELLK